MATTTTTVSYFYREAAHSIREMEKDGWAVRLLQPTMWSTTSGGSPNGETRTLERVMVVFEKCGASSEQ